MVLACHSLLCCALICIFSYCTSAASTNGDGHIDPDTPWIMQDFVAEVMTRIRPLFVTWSKELEQSYPRGAQMVSGIRAHAHPQAEWDRQRTERGWWYFLGLKSRMKRSSTSHATQIQDALAQFSNSDRGVELVNGMIDSIGPGTYLQFDRHMAFLVETAYSEFLDQYAELDIIDHPFARAKIVHSYLEVWSLDALSRLGHQILVKAQINKGIWRGERPPESWPANTEATHTCRIYLMQLYNEI